MRRALRGRESQETGDPSLPKPSLDNPSAFMAASMQAVIQKLREQEKELAALHRRDRERAQQTERLSEAVTRNMPAGLLLISSAGLITSANPAAEAALDVHALAYRRYAEVFGKESSLSTLLATCLSEGRTFRREEVEYATPQGELRQLGVTISPILGKSSQVTGCAVPAERPYANWRRCSARYRSRRTWPRWANSPLVLRMSSRMRWPRFPVTRR